MLTKSMRDDISTRLGLFVKYTVSGGFYFENFKNRFVPLTTYLDWTWRSTFVVAHLFQISLLVNMFYQTRPDHDTTKDKHKHTNTNKPIVGKNYLLVFTSGIVWVLVYQILAFASLCKQYRDEMVEAYNQVFILDCQLQKLFKVIGNNRQQKMIERLVKFICWFPPCLAPIFCASFFHAQDPIHNLYENLYEVQISVKSSGTWLIVGFECLCAFQLVGVVEHVVLIILVAEKFGSILA